MGVFDIFKGRDEPRRKAETLIAPGEESEPQLEEPIATDPALEKKSAPADRAEHGPFDEREAPDLGPHIDLGALRIPVREQLGLRLEVEEATGRLVAVALDLGASTMQVQAFAAPRTTGLWNDIRAQLLQQVTEQGGEGVERQGNVGDELNVTLHVPGEPAPRAVRFYGVDGPRWFLRAVLTGEALTNPAALAEMESLFRSIVVVRGTDPMPASELIPLVIPQALAEQMQGAAGEQAAPKL